MHHSKNYHNIKKKSSSAYSKSSSPNFKDSESSIAKAKTQIKHEKSENSQNLKGFYLIEKILGKKIDEDGEIKYKIKWMNFPQNQCTWEPISNLLDPEFKDTSGVPEMIEQFERRNKNKSFI